MLLDNLLTVVLLFVFCSALSLAAYLMATFRKDPRLYLLFTVCLLLALWSLGLALVRIAPSYHRALFWQRISALGWTTIYSVLLHIALVWSESHLRRKWWILVLVYFPALLSLSAFSLFLELAKSVQHLQLVNSVWVVLPVVDFWNLFFNLYCVTFVILSSLLFFRRGQKSENPLQRRWGIWLIFSLLSSLTLGVSLDRIFLSMYPSQLSNLAPGIILFPMTVLAVPVRTHQDFWGLKRRHFNQKVTRGEVLSEADKVSLYGFLSGIHLLAGFGYSALAIVAERTALESRVLFGILLALLGMGIYYLGSLEIAEERRDFLVNVVLSGSAFFLWFELTTVLRKWDILSTLSLLPFFLPAVLSGNSRALLVISAVFFAIHTYTWMSPRMAQNPPEVVLTQLLLTLLSGLFLLVILFIRRLYLRSLAENRHQMDMQELVANISSKLIGTRPQNLQENLQNVLCQLTATWAIPWAYFFGLAEDGNWQYSLHAGDDVLKIDSDEFLLLKRLVEQKPPFVIDDVQDCSLQGEELGNFLAKRNIRSAGVIPAQKDGRMLGFLILGAPFRGSWSKHQEESFQILGNVLAETLTRVEAELQLEHRALYDSLTELPNRVLFMDRLNKALQHAKRSGKLVAVVFLDMDSFKVINDSEGHETGDRLLKEIAQRLARYVREYDSVARFGGDEFLILLDSINQTDEIPPVVERILQGLQNPFFIGKQEFFLTASCGIALYPGDGELAEELIQAADLAMYAAKARGNGHYAFCSPRLREEAQQRQILISGLYKAMGRGELLIYYQPQIEVETGDIVGLEALLRWKHPELGLLLPASFIGLAEQKGLIVPIGEWVLRKACSQVVSWQKRGINIPRLAINLSPVQLRDPQLLEKVRRTLEDTSLAPGILELEVTENAVFHNPDEVITLLQALKHLGVRIALDDFGMGYSSLIRLTTLPVDRIKLDRHFFQNASFDSRDQAIAENIIQLAHSIEAAVIAEGVETEQELEFVVEHGCYEVQGYYYYHPLPPSEIEVLLQSKTQRPR